MQDVVSIDPTQISAPPSVQDVDRIASIADPVLRNLWITQHYHLLAVSLAAHAGQGANWCTFAVWASRQAGRTIRGEDLLDILEERLRHDPGLISGINRIWRSVFVHAMEHPESKRSLFLGIMTKGPLACASDAVARGNRKVYAEIAREFARFLPLCEGGPISPETLAAFLDGLRPGPPPDGQDDLRRAFTHYAAALQTPDPVAGAQLLLLANLQVGLHEQTRLQPDILAALEVPYDTVTEVGDALLHAIHPGSDDWSGAARTPVALLIGVAARVAAFTLRGVMRHLITERMMTLALPPAIVIHLGRNLDGEYPVQLRDPTNVALLDLLRRFSPPDQNPKDVGAYDWSVLEERMRLITRLFRLYHEDTTLFTGPYDVAQVAAFEAGRLPDGDL
jgi:hypothetical protein